MVRRYNLGFISNKDLFDHVKDTVEKYRFKIDLKKLEDLAKNQDTRAFEFSLIHYGLGNNDQAFKWLDIVCKNHEFGVVLLLGCESELWFEDLLPDPRFKEFLTRIGIEK